MGGVADEKVDLMPSLLRSFKTLNIPIDKSSIEEFMHIDDKNNKEFCQETLNGGNKVLKTIQAQATMQKLRAIIVLL